MSDDKKNPETAGKAEDTVEETADNEVRADNEAGGSVLDEAQKVLDAENNGDGSESGGDFAAKFDELVNENDALNDKVLRLVAEMENLRRRTAREKTEMAKYAISDFARDVLSIGDNLARALDHVPADAAAQDPALKSLMDGVQMTDRELHAVLERHGITRFDPRGERFDPNIHQAMMKVPDDSVEEGTIVEVMQHGYMIAQRVLRPAMVSISQGGPQAARPDGNQSTGVNEAPVQDGQTDREKNEAPETVRPVEDLPPGSKVDKSV